MSTLEIAVLVGSVALIAAVWMIPIGRSRPEEQSTETPQPAAAVGAEPTTAATAPVAASSQLAAVSPQPDVSVPAVSPPVEEWVSFPRESSMPREVAESIETPTPAPVRVSTVVSTTSNKLDVSTSRGLPASRRLTVAPADTVGTVAIAASATAAEAGGAASSSIYPRAVPIPIVVSMATFDDVPSSAADLGVESPLVRLGSGSANRHEPPIGPAPFENRSTETSSLTWSAHPPTQDVGWSSVPLWSGSQSIVARVSSADPDVRRNLALAAGAGMLLWLVVARR